jgi:hypothetical protein
MINKFKSLNQTPRENRDYYLQFAPDLEIARPDEFGQQTAYFMESESVKNGPNDSVITERIGSSTSPIFHKTPIPKHYINAQWQGNFNQ